MKNLLFLLLISFTITSYAQELNAVVVINAEQTGKSDLQVFRTLERQVTEFINNTVWTDKNYKQQERIDCSFNIIVSQLDADRFQASVQVQSSRPVFGSNYDSPLFNFNDRQFNFTYVEFQPLAYDRRTFSNNLVSTLAFYAYTIIGLDASSFVQGGGETYFEEAKQIVSNAQQSDSPGWKPVDGPQSRFRLNDDLLSPNFRDFSKVMYEYHRKGMDIMSTNQEDAKSQIAETLQLMRGMYNTRPNNFLSRVFFDAKAEEIASIYAGGPQVKITELVEVLNRVAPTKATLWRQIKF
ncbi:DUF4835 family protein [Dokdonia sinensis]|uniref:DUF4835 family protein n=1 Tax=Dokdonia sinensis TaxID=2479847 RepID=A0A3M0FUH1_9FLAO|nr:DUF4835 family protein [Dokdonia sinensis]RMB56135.1 DUF4835 family protein [Dokdonia sinensis]